MVIAQAQNDVVKHGIDASKKATINQDKLAKLQFLLTKGLYSDPESAIIVEWANNAVDAIVQAGKNPIENPVIVTIADNKFFVKDCGVGLNKEEFETVCMSYLSSTKEESNDQIGAFGIGMKSFMSLDRAATFTCRKNGYEWKFLAYQGVEFMEYDLISEKPTTEENGVICEITLQGWQEVRNFKEKAQAKLAYYDTVVLNMDGQIVDNNIIRSEKWQYSNQNKESKLHLCLKDVFYKIDYDRLGISAINIPIALRFNLNEGLQPTPSRESLIWNTHTINLVKEKIKRVATWFVNKYNESVPEEQELLKVFKDIDNDTKIVKLADKEFVINSLSQYSSVKPKELKIKGIEIENPEYYYKKRYQLLDEYEVVAENFNRWNNKVTKNADFEKALNKKLILVNSTPTHKVKSFLKDKYLNSYFIKKAKTRKLGKVTAPYSSRKDEDYIYLLNLVMKPKNTWRQLINEWNFVENQFKNLIIDETNVENSQEFIQYCIDKKEEAKNNRNSYNYSSKSNYVRINKTKEDITIQIAMRKEIGVGCKFVKKAVKIAELNKLHKNTHALHIYFPEEQKERASEFYELLHAKYNICILSPRELKRLQEFNPKQFMTEQEFLESRPFCKIMSGIKYSKAVKAYDNLYRHSDDIITNILSKFQKQRDELKAYIKKNGKDIDDNLLTELKEIAELKNLYDHSLDDVYSEFVKNIEKYEFINCLQKPRSWDDEEMAKYKRLVNAMLLLKSKYNNYDDLEIEVKPKSIAPTEETILEEQLEIV